MKFYNLNTKFNFGKFEGKMVIEILTIQDSYIDWCIINLDNFYITEEVVKEIKLLFPNFFISEEGQKKLSEKHESEKFQNEQGRHHFYDDSIDHRDYESDTFNALTDGQHGNYDDFQENSGGDMDNLRDILGF
jgi:hypothetical protein